MSQNKFTNTYKNTEISRNQRHKIQNASLPIKSNKACKDAGKYDQNEEKNHIIKTDLDIKALATIYDLFKYLSSNMEDVKKDLNETSRD